MTDGFRNTGIGAVGFRPWGTHFCNFYETKSDLVELLVPFFKAGLANKEFCVWILSEPLTKLEAWTALGEVTPELDEYVADGAMEVIDVREWYLNHGIFDLEQAVRACKDKLNRALDRGYAGMRITGDTTWLDRKNWRSFCAYEQEFNDNVADQRVTALCTYQLGKIRASDLLDVVSTHQFAVAMRHGSWELIETPELKQAKAEIQRMNDELELRVVQRTKDLEAANRKLRKAQSELARINRIMTMGELTTSIAQPLTAIVTNANAGVRLLARESPDLEELQQALLDIAAAGWQASYAISRFRTQMNKSENIKAQVDLNGCIQGVIELVGGDLTQNNVSLQTELSPALAPTLGDTVQLQQVILNLIMNGIEAMESVASDPKILFVKSQPCASGILISVRDSGVGMKPKSVARMFDAFFTTKPTGFGMGLCISRSIVERHGGQLWITHNEDRGITVQFTLPAYIL